jgi:DNA-binding CsgD family transcriptional regulator
VARHQSGLSPTAEVFASGTVPEIPSVAPDFLHLRDARRTVYSRCGERLGAHRGMAVINATHVLERESELAELVRDVAAARSGTGRIVLIKGPAGIGKTELLLSACWMAKDAGLLLARARGSELESRFAFGVVRQLFEPVLRVRSRRERDRLLTGTAGAAAGILGTREEGSARAEIRSAEALHALYWLTLNLAERDPLVALIDDVHWADRPSLRFVNYLAGRLEGVRALVLVAARSGRGEVLADVAREPTTIVLAPQPLSRGATAELLACEYGEAVAPVFAQACCEATGGNPFYLRELVRALRADGITPNAAEAPRVAGQGPASVARSVLTRIAGLSAEAASVARVLALLGGEAPLCDLIAVSSLSEDSVGTAVDALVGAEIAVGANLVAFAHPIVRASIYADIAAGERARSHLSAARALDEAGASSERTAAHLLSARPASDQWAVGVLTDAARGALSRGAPDSAVAYLTRALAEGPADEYRQQVIALLGRSEYLAYQPGARAHLLEAMDTASTPADRAELALQAARAMIMTDPDRSEAAIRLLDGAINDLAEPGSQLSRRLEAQVLAAAGLKLSTRPLQIDRLTSVHPRSLGDEPPDRLLLANLAFWTLIDGRTPGRFQDLARHAGAAGPPAEVACRVAERALAGGQLLREEGSDSQLFCAAVCTLCFGECLERAVYWLDQALEDARQRGSVLGYALTEAAQAVVAYRLGDLRQAETHASAASAISPEGAAAVLVNILIEEGRLDEAERVLAPFRIPPDADRLLLQPIRAATARLRIAQRRFQEGTRELLACADWLRAWPAENPAHVPWRSDLVPALIHLHHYDDARELATEEVTYARALGEPRALGIALRALGLAHQRGDAIDLLQESVDVLERSPAQLELARALTDFGAAIRRTGHRVEARRPLRDALALAHHCGATALRERAHQELLATGARPRRPALTGRDALTATEARVAHMAAQGQSTAEIAQTLFVTPKTIETHLSHTYQKLGIHARADLAEALAHPATRDD